MLLGLYYASREPILWILPFGMREQECKRGGPMEWDAHKVMINRDNHPSRYCDITLFFQPTDPSLINIGSEY